MDTRAFDHSVAPVTELPPDSPPSRLFARFAALGIPVETHRHAPVFTVEEAKFLRGQLPGGHCKNLFLRCKRKQSWLVVCDEDRAVDLNVLAKTLGAGRFSFGSADRLRETLGVEPGSVTPFALINDPQATVKVILDAGMMAFDPLNYHPLINTMTTAIGRDDLVRFIRACGHDPQVVDLDAAG